MRCVILQPSYLPWRGYFDLIRRADVFVFYDDVQYDKRSWRNRNRIKTPEGPKWLTIPVHARGVQQSATPINAIETMDDDWPAAHLAAIRRAYSHAPYFDRFAPWLESTYTARPPFLSPFTIQTTIDLAGMLGITGTTFLRSSDLGVSGYKTDRLLAILARVGATHYLSGPSAKDYIEVAKFEAAGIALEWMAYDYRPYPQLYPPFEPNVSVLDLLVMTGDEAGAYLDP